MKRTKLILLASMLISTVIISCNDESQKNLNEANKNIKEASEDVKDAAIAANDTAKANAKANWETFKNESDIAIGNMESDIKRLEDKLSRANTSAKAKLKMDIEKGRENIQMQKEKLKEKNAEFKKDINSYNSTIESKNQSFQREFKHDIKELGTAFKNLFKDNVQ